MPKRKRPGDCKIDGVEFNTIQFKTVIVYQLHQNPGPIKSGTLKAVSGGKVYFEEGHIEDQINMFYVGVATEQTRETWPEFKTRYKIGNKRKRLDHKIPLEEILPLVYSKSGITRTVIHGKSVKFRSSRLELFASDHEGHGTNCNDCGLEGQYFKLEQTIEGGSKPSKNNRYHLNLYAIDAEGDEVLLTKDHIMPKSKGGDHHLDNYQTLCYPCNQDKADTYETSAPGDAPGE
jgi:hypothetical protein